MESKTEFEENDLKNNACYLVLLIYFYDEDCNRIKYLISEESGMADIINQHFAKIRIDAYNFLPIEKILASHNVMILMKSVAKENKNKYYYDIFLEKDSYKDKSNT